LNKICRRAVEDDDEFVIVGRSSDGRSEEPSRALPVSADLDNWNIFENEFIFREKN
jgi:beta-xylosidase